MSLSHAALHRRCPFCAPLATLFCALWKPWNSEISVETSVALGQLYPSTLVVTTSLIGATIWQLFEGRSPYIGAGFSAWPPSQASLHALVQGVAPRAIAVFSRQGISKALKGQLPLTICKQQQPGDRIAAVSEQAKLISSREAGSLLIAHAAQEAPAACAAAHRCAAEGHQHLLGPEQVRAQPCSGM